MLIINTKVNETKTGLKHKKFSNNNLAKKKRLTNDNLCYKI